MKKTGVDYIVTEMKKVGCIIPKEIISIAKEIDNNIMTNYMQNVVDKIFISPKNYKNNKEESSSGLSKYEHELEKIVDYIKKEQSTLLCIGFLKRSICPHCGDIVTYLNHKRHLYMNCVALNPNSFEKTEERGQKIK